MQALDEVLQEQGKLKLDDPVGKFLPDLTRANEVTIRQLLSHTSGYQDYWPQDYLMPFIMKPTTPEKIMARQPNRSSSRLPTRAVATLPTPASARTTA